MSTVSHSCPTRARRAAQRGVSLLFSLMALVVLALAGVALVRSVDTGTMIMGNLGFKQDTLSASSAGAEEAITWLQTNLTSAAINSDQTADGYYSSDLENLDVTGNQTSAANKLAIVDWDGNSCAGVDATLFNGTCLVAKQGTNVNGNQVRYLIARLCRSTGATSGTNTCVRPASTATASASDRGELGGGGRISGVSASPYFRIIVRTRGARNTVSITETLVHF